MSESTHARGEPDSTPSAMHFPCLVLALLIMLVGTIWPPLMTNAAGLADHGLATALFMAMAAGFVRGVGFVPRYWLWRGLFSGWACAAALFTAVWLKWPY